MLYTISNETLCVQISDLGAQLWSIRTADGAEYLWQGDPRYWPDRTLNLFPQVGLCTWPGASVLLPARHPRPWCSTDRANPDPRS